MDKIISFIIPSYNVEQYLEKCLSSFLNPQAIEQMEVIIVDDGSKDRTARIAEDYVKPVSYTHLTLPTNSLV